MKPQSTGTFRIAGLYFDGTQIREGWGVSNVASGFGTLDLMKSGGIVRIQSGVAPPANGSANGPALLFSSTAGFGIYMGSSNPTFSAAQGSLYLRTDGSSGTTRAYINTNGSTSWTAFNTVA